MNALLVNCREPGRGSGSVVAAVAEKAWRKLLMESAPSASSGSPAGTPHAWATPLAPTQSMSGLEKRKLRKVEPAKYDMTSEKLLGSRVEHSMPPKVEQPPLEGVRVGS